MNTLPEERKSRHLRLQLVDRWLLPFIIAFQAAESVIAGLSTAASAFSSWLSKRERLFCSVLLFSPVRRPYRVDPHGCHEVVNLVNGQTKLRVSRLSGLDSAILLKPLPSGYPAAATL